MLIKIIIKSITSLILVSFFLFFKNNAKELEIYVDNTSANINFLSQVLTSKKNKYSSDLNNILINNDLIYVSDETIVIENYLNKNMTIVKVDYVKKSN